MAEKKFSPIKGKLKNSDRFSVGKLSAEATEGLTEYQAALYGSKVGGFTTLQRYLRTGETKNYGQEYEAADIQKFIDGVDAALEVSSLTENTLLYRGVHDARKMFGSSLEGLKVGEEFSDPGFVSASTSEKIVKDKFATPTNRGDKPLVFKIEAEAGTSAFNIDSLKDIGESEVLLPRGTKFRIESIRGNVVTLRVVPEPVVNPTRASANEYLFDLALRHQIDLRRFTQSEVKKILGLLEAIDAEATKKLRSGLAGLASGQPVRFSADQEKRLRALLDDVQLVRTAGWKQVESATMETVKELAASEAAVEIHTIEAATPVQLKLVGVEVSTLRAAVVGRPFEGKLLKDWFSGLAEADRTRLDQAVRLGLSQGENLDTIVRRVVGTRANKYTDGILTISRRNAEAVVRTAINHTSNVAREEVWSRNADIIVGLRWTATLDGRTSAVCRARDGHVAPLGTQPLPGGYDPLSPPGARPPAHINCRSTMVPILGGEQIVGERAFVTDTRTVKDQTKDFRADAKEQAGNKWKDMTPAERNKAIDKQRVSWAEKNIGRVPSTTSYNDWLFKQPAAFQDEVLGKTKGALFRRGGLTLDQYVDRNGNELTLEQLRSRYPDAFDKANVS